VSVIKSFVKKVNIKFFFFFPLKEKREKE